MMMIVRRRIKKKLFSADYSCNDRVMPVILMMTLLEGCLKHVINNDDEDHNNNEAN